MYTGSGKEGRATRTGTAQKGAAAAAVFSRSRARDPVDNYSGGRGLNAPSSSNCLRNNAARAAIYLCGLRRYRGGGGGVTELIVGSIKRRRVFNVRWSGLSEGYLGSAGKIGTLTIE